MKAPLLQSFRLRNFKAVRDSLTIRFSPLTVFIGNNGSGKSSIIEGLEMFQAIVERGLDEAAQEWRGFEHIWHQGFWHRDKDQDTRQDAYHKLIQKGEERPFYSNPMSFELRVKESRRILQAKTKITTGVNELLIRYEQAKDTTFFPDPVQGQIKRQRKYTRDAFGNVQEERLNFPPDVPVGQIIRAPIPAGASLIGRMIENFTSDWQFVSLAPQAMGAPIPQKRTGGPIRLAKDGSNIAEYLLSIRNIDLGVFNGILETLKYVLPYARDLQPTLTSELERTVYLQLTEKEFQVPGWLLSTGTLRVLALLALLRHPNPPSLIVIEEIENGLDPRTIHLMVDEIRQAVEAGRTQVIATTHSPYLLDLLTLSHLVLVERMEGQPVFIRPADQESLQNWVDRFGPGQLYTMGKLGSEQRP